MDVLKHIHFSLFHYVILSVVKDLIMSTLCKQILHFVQNDTT